jgi:hypothetical protein
LCCRSCGAETARAYSKIFVPADQSVMNGFEELQDTRIS